MNTPQRGFGQVTQTFLRGRPGGVIVLGIAIFLMANECVTRGYVTDDREQPLAGADVVIARGDRVTAATTTGEDGYFQFVHLPFSRRGKSMLICAPGHSAHISPQVGSALLRSNYGIGRYETRFPDDPAERGWLAPVPANCAGILRARAARAPTG